MKNRLIDANEFAIEEPKLWDWSSIDGISSTAVLKQCIWDVQCAPIVEAIPIELIKKKLLSCQYEYENDYDKGFDMGWNCAIKTLLKDWEKENEKQTVE